MKFLNKCGLLSLAFLTTFSAIASADNGEDRMVNKQLLQMLQNLQSAASGTSLVPVPNAVVSVGGTFRVIITVNRVSTNMEPMVCGADFSHFSLSAGAFYYEGANGRVIWSGNTGTCTISIPYIWKSADTLFGVGILTSISTHYPTCTTSCVERLINRTSYRSLSQITLPANGSITNITDIFRL